MDELIGIVLHLAFVGFLFLSLIYILRVVFFISLPSSRRARNAEPIMAKNQNKRAAEGTDCPNSRSMGHSIVQRVPY